MFCAQFDVPGVGKEAATGRCIVEPAPHPPPDTAASPLEMSPEDAEVIEEPVKTFLSFLWLWSGFFATTTSLALTHEKVRNTSSTNIYFR